MLTIILVFLLTKRQNNEWLYNVYFIEYLILIHQRAFFREFVFHISNYECSIRSNYQ